MILVSLVWTPSGCFSAFQHAADRPGAAESGILALHTSTEIAVPEEIKEEGVLDAWLQCLVATNHVQAGPGPQVNEDGGHCWAK